MILCLLKLAIDVRYRSSTRQVNNVRPRRTPAWPGVNECIGNGSLLRAETAVSAGTTGYIGRMLNDNAV